MEIVENATPLSGGALDRVKQAYDRYLETIIEHDPGVGGFKMLFGEKGGVERSLNMHFDR